MTIKSSRGFAARPGDPDAWVRTADKSDQGGAAKGDQFTARLTIDVTPDLRGRIKVIAFRRGVTVADMLRDLLAREFPNDDGGKA
jgi:hypothetical protein